MAHGSSSNPGSTPTTPPTCPTCSTTCSTDASSAPAASTGGVKGAKVQLATGGLQFSAQDLSSGGATQGFGQARSFSNTLGGLSGGVNGNGWFTEQVPTLAFQPNGGVGVIGQAANALWFNAPAGGGSTGTYPPAFAFTASLSYASNQFTLTAGDGSTQRFNGAGQLTLLTDAGGNVGSTGYNARQQLTSLSFTAAGSSAPTSVYQYAYVASGPNQDQLASVTYLVNNVGVRRSRYVYYGTGENYGNVNDLKLAYVDTWNAATGQWQTLSTSYYRYYLPGQAGGYVSGLRFVVNSQAYALMVAANLNPTTATDTQVAAYADLYVEYDGARRVSLQQASGGAYTYGFAYATSGNAWGTNAWATKTTETLPDGNQNVVYGNGQGQAMLRVFVELATGNQWCTYWRYDAQGKGILRAEPSAVASYSEASPGLVTLNAGTGLVHTFNYYDASDTGAGAAPGYFQSEGVQQGGAGSPTLVRGVTYTSQTLAGTGSVYPVATSTLYQNDAGGGSAPATTTYSYQWYANTLQMSQRVTSLPVVPAAQNGSGLADSRTDVFDSYGWLTWSRDERGFISYMAYDPVTGAVTQRIQDVQTSGRSDVPGGWTTPAGGGLNLVSDYQFDPLGRTTQLLGPTHTLSLNGPATSIRRATWTVYQDVSYQVWTGRGYVNADGSNPTLVNPVGLAGVDQAGRTLDAIQAVRGSGLTSPGALSASDTFAQSTWSRWAHTSYDQYSHLTSLRTYYAIPASGSGSVGTNYNEALYGYDAVGRQIRSVTPGGTITRTTFSARGWATGSWVGTNDAGATPADPTGNHASGNNLVQVSASQYDGGAAGGDGNLTQTTLYQDASTTRVTTFTYDYRDRQVTMTPPVGATSAYTLDNLGRTVQVDQHDPSNGNLVARRATGYDGRGRTYQSIVYGVNPATGAVGNALTSRTWYDPSGNIIKQLNAGSQSATKTVYDGVGRPTIVYTSINAAETGYPYPVSVANDTVIQQVESLYDAASNQVARTTRERDHNATGTGALTTPAGAQPQARVSYMAGYPDALGRTVINADYGTNAGATWSYPAVAPTPGTTATVLASASAYDAAGNRFQHTDAQDTVTQTSFDQAGRQTRQINNVVAGGTQPDQNQETDYTYNADSRVLTLTARNSVTGDQTTSFIYGTTIASGGSDVASNELLVQKTYPANSGSNPDALTYTYNRQGEVKGRTDGNGTVHGYVYDALGRLLQDSVSTVGSGVDGTVRRVSRVYEVRGLLQAATSFDSAVVGQGSVVNDVLLGYNGFGQLVADYQAHNGAVDTSSTLSVQYAYADGSANTVRRTGLTYPSGRTLSLSYGPSGSLADDLNRLDSIVDAAPGATLASFAYLGLDTRVQIAYPEPAVQLTLIGTPGGDGGDQYVGLDRFGRLVDQRWTNNAGTQDLERVQFGYSPASNKTWRHNTVAAAAGVARDEFYGNDGLYQLKLRQQGTLNSGKTGINGTPVAEEDFTFDPTGNWTNYETQANGSPVLNQARTHNVDNEITALAGSSALVGYDHAGNMTTMPQPSNGSAAYTVTWDAWNRPVAVQSGGTTVALYAYDGLTRRTHRGASASAGSDFFYSDQWKVLEERVKATRTSASSKQFVWCGCSADKLVLRDVNNPAAPTPNTRLYAMDDGKDVTAVCDPTGAVQERYGYSGFGTPSFLDAGFNARTTSSYNWETLFCGYRYDADTGLYQVRYRYLHAQLGRWLSRDPVGQMLKFNLYHYADNSPTNKTDKMGLDPHDFPGPGDHPTYCKFGICEDATRDLAPAFADRTRSKLYGSCCLCVYHLQTRTDYYRLPAWYQYDNYITVVTWSLSISCSSTNPSMSAELACQGIEDINDTLSGEKETATSSLGSQTSVNPLDVLSAIGSIASIISLFMAL